MKEEKANREKKTGKKKLAGAVASEDKIVNIKKKVKENSKKTKSLTTSEKSASEASEICKDKDCPVHGKLKVRGRIFEGRVIRKFPKRITIEFERMIYIRKYERYTRLRTKIHARLPECMEKKVDIGDLIKIQECRPLSKIIHFVVIEKLNQEEKEN